MEIDVEGINPEELELITANLTNNGYYEYKFNEEEGKDELTLIENYQEGQDYDVQVNVPPPQLQSKTVNVTNNSPSQQIISPDQGIYGLSSVTVNNNVVIPTLETLTNKRLQQDRMYTISDLMQDSTNNAGITKNSTLIVDLYIPDIRFNPITNNNADYTLAQLTQDPSNCFSRNSIIKANIDNRKVLSVNNFKLQNDRLSNYSLNQQPINWTYNLTSTTGNYSGALMLEECPDYYFLRLIRVEDGETTNLVKNSVSIGNRLYTSITTGEYLTGNLSVTLNNLRFFSMYSRRNTNPDLTENIIRLYKTDYLISDF